MISLLIWMPNEDVAGGKRFRWILEAVSEDVLLKKKILLSISLVDGRRAEGRLAE
jgi:hypothetical protein